MTQVALAYKKSAEETEEQDQIILNELPQVSHIARRIYGRLPQHVPFEDLVNAGVIGLIEAARSYDPSKSVPFNAYAKFRVRGAILDSLRELDWGSRPLRRKGRLIEDAIVKLSAKLGRQPEEQEIAAELGLSLEQLYATAIRLDGLTLIGQEVCASYDRSEKTDLIESAPSREASPFDCCLHSEIKEQLAAAIETLSEKEQLVVSLYYKEELTMKEIAAVLRLGESRVCQLHAIALPKLRAALRKASFDETLL